MESRFKVAAEKTHLPLQWHEMYHNAPHAQQAVESLHILNRKIQVLKNIDGCNAIKQAIHFFRKFSRKEEESIHIIG